MAERQKILVTGSSGQLGSELKVLSERYPRYEFLFPSAQDLRIDDFESINSLFRSFTPGYCINCAAYTAVDKAEADKDQAFLVNATAVGKLAAICKELNTRLIHISTDYVFDGKATQPYMENSVTNPGNVYGGSKLEGEKEAIRNNADSLIIRTSWVYSPFGKNFVRTMIGLMKEKQEINVVNDQFGSPTYAADLAEAIMTIISSGNWYPGIFHFSNTGGISWFQFAEAINRHLGSNCRINGISTSQYPTLASRPAYSVLSLDKIRETYAIQPRPWQSSLEKCMQRLIP